LIAEAPRPSRRRVTIRTKLMAGSALLLVGSTLLYGYAAFATARSALLPSIREQLADDAVNVKGGLEEMLTAHYRNVNTWAHLGLMRELVVHDMDKTVAHFLASLKADYGVYIDVVALDPDGDCVASSQAEDIGRSFAGTALFRRDDDPGALSPSFERSERLGAEYLRLAAPIPDPDRPERRLGTLVAMLARSVLDRIVVSKPGHSQVELRLFDGDGRLVAGRRPPLDIRRIVDWRVTDQDNPGHFPAGSPPLIHEGIDAAGRSWILANMPIGNSDMLPTPGWHLTASVPKDVVLAPVLAVRDIVLGTGFGVIVLGLLAAAVLAQRLTRPINELTLVATRIARTGDLEPVPPSRSHDEVGELAAAFQQMVTAVANANDEMVRTSKLAFLGEMAAGMAHEIRTPLGIIRNAAQLLERRMTGAGDQEAGEWAVFIREESDRLARVVTDLLDFVKPKPPLKTETDLGVLVRRAVGMLGSEAANRDIVLEVHCVEPVTAECDADQIHQVCLNLVMNALQASSPGGRVDVKVSQRGETAELAVRDRGRGIPPDLVDRLFEPFTSERDGGIGLGLAIVRRIVRAHGGEVTARNRGGGGAEFFVTLPKETP
jgi:two-component system sensor histidine kinase HydH